MTQKDQLRTLIQSYRDAILEVNGDVDAHALVSNSDVHLDLMNSTPGNDWDMRSLALTMIEDMEVMLNEEEISDKFHRWLGFLQGIMWCTELRTISQMRDESRPIFKEKFYACAFGDDGIDGDSMYQPVFFECDKNATSKELWESFVEFENSRYDEHWHPDEIKEMMEDYENSLCGFWILTQKAKEGIDQQLRNFPDVGNDSAVYAITCSIKSSIRGIALKTVECASPFKSTE